MNTIAVYPEVATIEAQGCISAANASDFQQELAQAVTTGQHSVLLVDMQQVEFLDSAGLMALINVFRLAQNIGRRLSFCSVAPSVKIIFELTQLDRVFDIFDHKDSFIASLDQPMAA